jgi:hypothetical protein
LQPPCEPCTCHDTVATSECDQHLIRPGGSGTTYPGSSSPHSFIATDQCIAHDCTKPPGTLIIGDSACVKKWHVLTVTNDGRVSLLSHLTKREADAIVKHIHTGCCTPALGEACSCMSSPGDIRTVEEFE